MLKKYYRAIFYSILYISTGIFAYWYLNYYLIHATRYPDGTELGSIKEMTFTRSWILIGSFLLSFASLILFLYHTVKSFKKRHSNKTSNQ